MRIKMLWKRQDGVALVMVMIIFMVVALLGAAIATLSLGEFKQSVALDKDMRAYYQARSAADATAFWIRNKYIDLKLNELYTSSLNEALKKMTDALAEGTLDPAVLDEFAVGCGYPEDNHTVTNLEALGTAVGKYDFSKDADLGSNAEVLNEIAYFLNVMTFKPLGAPLDPYPVLDDLDKYLDKAGDAYEDAVSVHDAKEGEYEQVVLESGTNTANVTSANSDVITGVGNDGVVVQRIAPDIYVKATAEVYGISSAAVVRLKETELSKIAALFADAIYAAGEIEITSGNAYDVYGHASYGTLKDLKFDRISLGTDMNDGFNYPDWPPPGGLPKKTLPAGGSKLTKSVPLSNGFYSVTPSVPAPTGYYSIDATGGDVILHFEKIDLSAQASTITVKGSGNVYLFIDEINDPDKKIKLNIDSGDLNAYVYVIFDESVKKVELTGECKLEAFVYAPNAIVDIGGNTIITGAVISKDFINGNGNFTVNYNPCNISFGDSNDFPGSSKAKQWLKEEQWPEPE